MQYYVSTLDEEQEQEALVRSKQPECDVSEFVSG